MFIGIFDSIFLLLRICLCLHQDSFASTIRFGTFALGVKFIVLSKCTNWSSKNISASNGIKAQSSKSKKTPAKPKKASSRAKKEPQDDNDGI